MKLLHTESSMNLGGQELRVLVEMERMAARGFESVLAARPGSRILAEAESRGLKAYAVPMRGSFDPPAVARLMRIIRSENITLVCTHGSKDGWSAGLAARMLGRRIIRYRHVANPIRGNILGRLVYGPLCDLIVTTSESIKRGMAEKGVRGEKIISVPTGVDVSLFNPDVRKGSFRAELKVPKDAPIVGMVSVVRGDKGPDVFVQAAEEVIRARPRTYFALVGDGWMLEKIRGMVRASLYRDNIIVAGRRNDIPAVMADLNVMCLPAKAPEGVPQVVLQAHAMKVPVVASETGGINEVAINNQTALTVTPGDHVALAGAVTRLLDDRDFAARLAENGFDMVTERYSLERMLDEMEAVYRNAG